MPLTNGSNSNEISAINGGVINSTDEEARADGTLPVVAIVNILEQQEKLEERQRQRQETAQTRQEATDRKDERLQQPRQQETETEDAATGGHQVNEQDTNIELARERIDEIQQELEDLEGGLTLKGGRNVGFGVVATGIAANNNADMEYDGEIPGAYALGGAEIPGVARPGSTGGQEETGAENATMVEPLVEASLVVETLPEPSATDMMVSASTVPEEPLIMAEAKTIHTMDAIGLCLNSPLKKAAAIAFILGIIGLIIGLVVRAQSSSEDSSLSSTVTVTSVPTLAPTPAPSPAPTVAFTFEALPDYTQETIQNDVDFVTPQAKAWQWVQKDPNLLEYSYERNLQRFAMAAFFYSTNPNLDGSDINISKGDVSWLQSVSWLQHNISECEWGHTLYVDMFSNEPPCSEDGELRHLTLPENNLAGTLPLELSILTKLVTIEFNSNPSLAGTFPTIFWELPLSHNMIHIDIGGTGIAGGFHGEQLQKLTNLRKFEVEKCPQWTGTLPTEIGLMTALENIQFNYNPRMDPGPIPSEIGLLTNLEIVQLQDLWLTGPLPTEIGLLSRVGNLMLQENTFTGTMPSELGMLSSLEWFSLAESLLTGLIPTELGRVPMIGLNVQGNRLSSTIPTELCNLRRMRMIYAKENVLIGSIPTCFGNLSDMAELLLAGNQLVGALPSELQGMTNLAIAELGRNRLTGTLPTELAKITSLFVLDLAITAMNGTIPTEFGGFPVMEILNLSFGGNARGGFSGPLPSELGLLRQLKSLAVNSNQLEGPIPDEIWGLRVLQELELSNNAFSGSLSSVIGEATSLVNLRLHANNKLMGQLPSEIGSLNSLVDLTLQDTSLTGEIPTQVCDAANLVLLFDCSKSLCGCQCTCAAEAAADAVASQQNATTPIDRVQSGGLRHLRSST